MGSGLRFAVAVAFATLCALALPLALGAAEETWAAGSEAKGDIFTRWFAVSNTTITTTPRRLGSRRNIQGSGGETCKTSKDCNKPKICVDGTCTCPVLYRGSDSCAPTVLPDNSSDWCVMPVNSPRFRKYTTDKYKENRRKKRRNFWNPDNAQWKFFGDATGSKVLPPLSLSPSLSLTHFSIPLQVGIPLTCFFAPPRPNPALQVPGQQRLREVCCGGELELSHEEGERASH